MRDVELPLAYHRSLGDWKPQVGDFIVKHGWFSRTKWFGIVKYVEPEGYFKIAKEGSIPLLMSSVDEIPSEQMHIREIKNTLKGSYSILQQDHNRNPIWYI